MANVAQEQANSPNRSQLFGTISQALFRAIPGFRGAFCGKGLLYAHGGAQPWALSKFYAVMTSALSLKGRQLDYYQRLVSARAMKSQKLLRARQV